MGNNAGHYVARGAQHGAEERRPADVGVAGVPVRIGAESCEHLIARARILIGALDLDYRAVDAATAYNFKALEIFGEFARFNSA
jgi:hypothetical protein